MKIYSKSSAILIAATCAGTAVAQFDLIEQLNNAPDEASLIALHQELDVARGNLDEQPFVFFADFFEMSRSYGLGDVGYAQGDINLDGVVDLADYAILGANQGNEGYMPEPSSKPPEANLGLWLNDDNELVVSNSNPTIIGGMEIVSTGAAFTPITDLAGSPAPFTVRIRRLDSEPISENSTSWFSTEEQPEDRFGFWSVGGFETPLIGDVSTGYTADSTDVKVRWFEEGSYDVYELDFGVGDALTGQEAPRFIQEPPGPIDLQQPAELSDPSAPTTIRPLELVDPRFGEVSNLEDLIALHESANVPRGDIDTNGGVEFADFLHMSASYGSEVETDQYGSGDINLDGKVDLGDFAILSTNFGTEEFTPDPPAADRVELTPSLNGERKVVITSGEPVQIGGLEIRSANGALQTIDDGGSAAPFSFALGESNTDSVTFVSLGNSVEIAGEIVTTVTADTDAELALTWFQEGSYEIFSTSNGLGASLATGDTLVGDIDKDGQVALADFLILSDNYGQEVAVGESGDFDGDGKVDFPDFLLLSENFGATSPIAVAVPEPSAVQMVAALVLLMCFRRRL